MCSLQYHFITISQDSSRSYAFNLPVFIRSLIRGGTWRSAICGGTWRSAIRGGTWRSAICGILILKINILQEF